MADLPATHLTILRFIYAANIVVAGAVGISSLFTPERAVNSVFEGLASPDMPIRVVGALWTTIAILSALGLVWPVRFSPVLLLQLVYKGGWLLVVALPVVMQGSLKGLPMGITSFFLMWVLVLLFALPYRALFDTP
ncbi:MAG: hypothetical protein RhofKO_28260 [Rhodothermales bacterium]